MADPAAAVALDQPGDDQRDINDAGGQERAAVDHQRQCRDHRQRDGGRRDADVAADIVERHRHGIDQRRRRQKVQPESRRRVPAQPMGVACVKPHPGDKGCDAKDKRRQRKARVRPQVERPRQTAVQEPANRFDRGG